MTLMQLICRQVLMRFFGAALSLACGLLIVFVTPALAGYGSSSGSGSASRLNNPAWESPVTAKKMLEKRWKAIRARTQSRREIPAHPQDPPNNNIQAEAEEPNENNVVYEKAIAGCTRRQPVVAEGWCTPGGEYDWTTPEGLHLHGHCPFPGYRQTVPKTQGYAPGRFADSGYPGAVKQVLDFLPVDGRSTPISNAEFAVIASCSAQQLAQFINDPEKRIQAAQAESFTKDAETASCAAECAEANQKACFQSMTAYLINVANEEAGQPTSSRAASKSYSNAVWMIQQMFKTCYLPMGFLFVLPGAILTQTKAIVVHGTLRSRDEDASSGPIVGLMRSAIAIFLIPATQLAVSYLIDTGNAMTDCISNELKNQQALQRIEDWSRQQTYDLAAPQQSNYIRNHTPYLGDPLVGKVSGAAEEQGTFEQQTVPSSAMQNKFNVFNQMMTEGLCILNAFQLVTVCYLFLLGPIAAAFFAWPGGVGKESSQLFRRTFSSWLDGLVILVLWKFWWNIILLIMVLRLNGGLPDQNNEFELFIYTACLVMLMFVPFNPFEFKPSPGLIDALIAQGQAVAKPKNNGNSGRNNNSGSSNRSGTPPGPSAITGGSGSSQPAVAV